MASIEYFYSAHSAYAYLGSSLFLKTAKAAGRTIVHKPYFLTAGIAGVGSPPTRDRAPAARNYYFGREIERWGEHRGVDVLGAAPPNHWNDMTLANCLLIAAADAPEGADALSDALLEAHWRDSADLADRGVLASLTLGVGLESDRLLGQAETDAVRAQYEANTAEAIKRTVFGSPTYFVDGDMFYGQDHLEMIERACRQPYKGAWPRD
jgi:2-hydroxychromene-2-carboxylate isomerase